MKILIADDQPLDRSVLRLSLEKWDYEVVEAADGKEAYDILISEDAPTLAIVDWMMPGMTGPEICQNLRKANLPRYTYTLLLTSKDDKDDLVEGLQSGADDYIVKPVDMHELQVRLRAGRRIVELQEELIATREELRIQATRDFLTGLWNRGVISEKLDEEVHRASRRGDSLSVIMCDIDKFKGVNDTHGHTVGDEVIVEIADRIEKALRTYDAGGRYGGEEFLIVLPETDVAGANTVAERIRGLIADSPVDTAVGAVPITMSLGVTGRVMTSDIAAKGLIEEADRALYQAKAGGRNRVETAREIVNS